MRPERFKTCSEGALTIQTWENVSNKINEPWFISNKSITDINRRINEDRESLPYGRMSAKTRNDTKSPVIKTSG